MTADSGDEEAAWRKGVGGGSIFTVGFCCQSGMSFFSSKLSFILFILSPSTCICSQLSSVEMLKVVGERVRKMMNW